MQAHREEYPLTIDAPNEARRIRAVLAQAEYTEARILDCLRARELPSASARASLLPLWQQRTPGGSLLDTFIRLFLLHAAVAPEAFAQAAGLTRLDEWTHLGLVEQGENGVIATVQLLPYGDLILASDWPGQPAALREHVMAVAGSSRTLADFTLRRPARQTLDLGTGCGVQALLAASHSDTVWAVDRNPRAVRFAAFNAQFNDRANIHCLEGDLFEPVQGRQFDLVVANLPFVISPEHRYLYCQGGRRADDLCREVVQAVPPYLREGGCCQIVSDLAHITGQDWRQRLAAWFAGIGCDAWVFSSLKVDVAAYAAQWLRETEGADLRPLAGRFEEWLAYYEREGIEAVSFGLIVLRRAPGRRNWFRCEEVPGAQTPGGEALVRRFALRDFLDTLPGDDDLLRVRLRRSPHLRWEYELGPSEQGWGVPASRLRLADGWGAQAVDDVLTQALLSDFEDGVPLRDVLARVLGAAGPESAERTRLAVARVRELIEQGYLWPA